MVTWQTVPPRILLRKGRVCSKENYKIEIETEIEINRNRKVWVERDFKFGHFHCACLFVLWWVYLPGIQPLNDCAIHTVNGKNRS